MGLPFAGAKTQKVKSIFLYRGQQVPFSQYLHLKI
uniref:Uncharacterized protein n=1 Tax=Rhizophora mucronata TaxID=61149 RepID=A0A2P2Q8J4_RHIMU